MTEKRNYIRVRGPSGRWKGEAIGDELEGKLVNKEPTTFRGRPNYKYWIETSHPEAVDKTVMVYGTGALNSAFKKIPEGYYVKIVYQGERPSADPKHKPYQLYDVFVDVQEDDPLYEKIAFEENGKKNQAPGQEMKANDDPEATTMIEHYIGLLKDQYQEVNDENIVEIATSDPDLEPEDLTRVKAQVVEMVRAGELKTKLESSD